MARRKKSAEADLQAGASKESAELQEEALHPTKPNDPVRASYASQAEQKICSRLEKLSALGQPVKDLVQGAAIAAEADAARRRIRREARRAIRAHPSDGSQPAPGKHR